MGSGLTAAQLLTAFANSVEFVNNTAFAVTTYQQAAIAATAIPIGPTIGPVTGSTFTLTAGLDSIVGNSGDDTINGGNSTLQTTDVIDGGGGKDTLNFVNSSAAALPAAKITNVETFNIQATSNLNSTDLSIYTGLTAFNADRSTATTTAINAPAGLAYGLLGDGSTLSHGSFNFGYAAGANVATLNLAGGVKSSAGTNVFLTGADVTSTVINSTGAANSLSTINTAGVIVTAASSTAITINATTNLTAALSSTNDSKLTVTGTGVVDLRGVNYGFSLNKNITTIDASAQTAGGTLIQAGNPSNASTLKFIGGAGDDSVGLGTVLAAGASLDGGAGTDTVRTNNATFITAITGAFIKNFEIVDVAANITIDLAHLAGNNTLTGLRLGGASNVVNNVSATVANNVTIYASGSPNLNLIGATSVGQVDTVSINANDGNTAVNTINMGAPGMTGVEKLNLIATDNIIISDLNNATSLDSIKITGAGNVSITTGAIAVNTGSTVDATAATGNFTFNATSATTNGYTIKGSSGVNTITGGGLADTIVGGGGADKITGGAGADQITISGNATTLINVALGNSGANTSTNIQTAELTSTFDVVRGALAGDKIQLFTSTPSVNLTATNLAGTDDTANFARGTYDSLAGTFTYGAGGADTALTYDTTVGRGTAFETIILVGFVAGNTTSIGAGLITLA